MMNDYINFPLIAAKYYIKTYTIQLYIGAGFIDSILWMLYLYDISSSKGDYFFITFAAIILSIGWPLDLFYNIVIGIFR